MADKLYQDYLSATAGNYKLYHDFLPPTRQKTIDSDAKVVSRVDETIDSDATIRVFYQQTIDSDGHIKVVGSQQTINSDSKVIAGRFSDTIDSDAIVKQIIQQTINSDATIKMPVQQTINSDGHIRVIGAQQTITSDATITTHNHQYINSDASIKVLGVQQTIDSDGKVVIRYLKTIDSDCSIKYYKDFYVKQRAQKDYEKDFYEQLIVNQPAPTDPTGLTCTDLKTGEALFLTWTGTNYGWNVYKDVGGVWTKQNLTLITSNNYVVGSLVTGVTYSFKVKGVNGIGTESTGVITSGTPTFDITRYKKPIWDIKIGGLTQTDAILDRVELVYGPSLSMASFHIQKSPLTPGLPDANKQSVQVYVNSRLIFTGYLIRKTDIIKATDLRVDYEAVSKVWDYTWETVGKNYNEQKGQHITSIDINTILYDSDCPADLPSTLLYGEVTVADNTKLDLMEAMLRYAGNYKIYTSPEGNTNYYQIGNPVSNRTFEVGKHILEKEESKTISDKIDEVTVKSDYKIITICRTLVSYGGPIWRNGKIGDRDDLNRSIDSDADGNLYLNERVYGNQISDIQFEALVNEKPVATKYLEGVDVLPSHVGLTKWPDGSTNGKKAILEYKEFTPTWKSISSKINYSHYGTYADCILSPVPVRYVANVIKYTAYFKGVDPISKAVTDVTTDIYLMFEPTEWLASIREIHTYKSTVRLTQTIGSGTIKRTYHDSIQPYYINTPHEQDSNYTDVQSYINAKAQSEYDRLSKDSIGGSLSVLGDETIDLRTIVNGMEVMKVVHDFSNGYIVYLDLTNEQYYFGEYVMERKETKEHKDLTKKVEDKTITLDYNMNQYKEIVGANTNKPTTTTNPESGIGSYSD